MFTRRILAMNAMYKLPINGTPTVLSDAEIRLPAFRRTLMDEINEINEITDGIATGDVRDADMLVMLADLLGDIVVYCHSEAMKYGIPLEAVLDIIMDSNESKLGADGQPIYNADGKFLKGPNYWKPEPKIKALLDLYGARA